jgi:hypothetical protein
LREAGAGKIAEPGWSDRQGQLVKGSRHPQRHGFLNLATSVNNREGSIVGGGAVPSEGIVPPLHRGLGRRPGDRRSGPVGPGSRCTTLVAAKARQVNAAAAAITVRSSLRSALSLFRTDAEPVSSSSATRKVSDVTDSTGRCTPAQMRVHSRDCARQQQPPKNAAQRSTVTCPPALPTRITGC